MHVNNTRYTLNTQCSQAASKYLMVNPILHFDPSSVLPDDYCKQLSAFSLHYAMPVSGISVLCVALGLKILLYTEHRLFRKLDNRHWRRNFNSRMQRLAATRCLPRRTAAANKQTHKTMTVPRKQCETSERKKSKRNKEFERKRKKTQHWTWWKWTRDTWTFRNWRPGNESQLDL